MSSFKEQNNSPINDSSITFKELLAVCAVIPLEIFILLREFFFNKNKK